MICFKSFDVFLSEDLKKVKKFNVTPMFKRSLENVFVNLSNFNSFHSFFILGGNLVVKFANFDSN
jgi:hypothetical protein